MELQVLNRLGWKLNIVTPAVYFEILVPLFPLPTDDAEQIYRRADRILCASQSGTFY
jgi:hypothetical protein